jgi:hypothetical protein
MDQLESKLKDILSGLQLDIMDQFRQISRSQDPNLKKVVSKTLSDNDAAYIIALGDAHLGSLFCNEKLFSETINFILNTPNVYTILLGDLAETATRTSIGLGIFDEKYHIDKQLDVIVEPAHRRRSRLGPVGCGAVLADDLADLKFTKLPNHQRPDE